MNERLILDAPLISPSLPFDPPSITPYHYNLCKNEILISKKKEEEEAKIIYSRAVIHSYGPGAEAISR